MAPTNDIDHSIGNTDNTIIIPHPSTPPRSRKITHTTSCMSFLRVIPRGLESFFSRLRHSKNTNETAQQSTNRNVRSSDDVENGNQEHDEAPLLPSFSFSNNDNTNTDLQHVFAERSTEHAAIDVEASNQQNNYSTLPPVVNYKRPSTYELLTRRLSYGQSQVPHQPSMVSTEEHVVDKQDKYANAADPQLESKLGSLPLDLLLPIFEQRLPGKDLVRMRRVCQRFNSISAAVLNGNSSAARDARSEARDSVRYDINRLFREDASSVIFKETIETLIGRHCDIGVDFGLSHSSHPMYFDILLSVLAKQTHVRSLAVQITASGFDLERIISALATIGSNCKPKELHVCIECRMSPVQAETLAGVRPLTSIEIRNDCSLGYRPLQALLANPTTTRIVFDTDNVQEGHAEWALVKQALADNKTIEELEIWHVSDEALAVIAPALEKHTSLETLILNNCQLKPYSLQALGTALEDNTRLTSLEIICSDIDDAGVEVFAPALEKNKALRKLNLAGNKFQFHGAQALARSLKHNTTLTTVDLSYIKFGSNGIEVLADAALHMTNLAELNLTHMAATGSSISEAALEALRTAKPSLKIWVTR